MVESDIKYGEKTIGGLIISKGSEDLKMPELRMQKLKQGL